jgi:omega-amidase
VKVAAVQHDIVWNDREANFARLAPRIRDAATLGADLVVLTETFSTGFVVDVPDIGEPEGGPSAQFLGNQAAEHGVWVCGSCPEIADGAATDDRRPFNTFVFAGPDGATHRYRKIHTFTYGGEPKHFGAGTELTSFTIAGARVTPLVCYDLRFADEFWQRADGTDVYVVTANWPAPRRLHWKALLQARAIENLAYVVAPAQWGRHSANRLTYGNAMVVDPWGTVLARCGDGEGVCVAPFRRDRIAQVRRELPSLSHRRLR